MYSNRITSLCFNSLISIRLLSTKIHCFPYFNHIYALVSNNRPLTEDDKPILKNYWEFMTKEFPQSKTILTETTMDQFKHFIETNEKKSSIIRAFYRREIILNKNNINLLKLIKKDIDNPLDFCIRDSLSTKDILIAADLFLLYYELYPHEHLRQILASEIISAMTFQDPRYDHFHLIKFLKIIELFQQKNQRLKLTSSQVNTLSNKALSLNKFPGLRKKVLIELMQNFKHTSVITRDHSTAAAYQLIQNDYKSRNAAGVFLTWSTVENHYENLEKHDPSILNMVLKTFINNKTYKNASKHIISKLSPEYYSNNPLILPTIINYFTRVGNLDQAQNLMNTVNANIKPENTPIVLHSRRCLSSLLKMHLRFNDSQGVDNALKQIQEIHGDHSQEDFQAIVAHLLQTKTLDNIVKAVNLVSQIPKTKTLLAYASIANTIVDWQIASNGKFDEKSMHLLNDIFKTAHEVDPQHKNTLWSIQASLYIKKLVHYKNFKALPRSKKDTTNLDLAKLIFLKSTSNKGMLSTVNPFSFSTPQDIILRVTNKNKIIILKNIALSAIKGYRRDIFLWCCTELYHKGVPSKELVLDWHAIFDYKSRPTKTAKWNGIRGRASINSWPFKKKIKKKTIKK